MIGMMHRDRSLSGDVLVDLRAAAECQDLALMERLLYERAQEINAALHEA